MSNDLIFETEPCGRCGGTGHYSRCQTYGTTCFKCRGAKRAYTNRGQAAYNMLIESLSKPLTEIKIGDKLWTEFFYAGKMAWATVIEIKPVDGGLIDYVVEHPKYGQLGCSGNPANSRVRYAHTEAEKAPKIAAALAYQSTLTAAGKPRKGAAL